MIPLLNVPFEDCKYGRGQPACPLHRASNPLQWNHSPATDPYKQNHHQQHLRCKSGQHNSKHDGPRVKPQGHRDPDQPSFARNHSSQVKLACCNVRTMSDENTIRRHAPEHRSALVSLELERLNIDIACLSKCRISGKANLSKETTPFFIQDDPQDKPNSKGRLSQSKILSAPL